MSAADMRDSSHQREATPGHGHGTAGRALAFGLVLTLAFAGVEVVAGFISGSLALLADAGHMLIDSAGLVLALGAALMARRPADPRRTYGYARVEVLIVPLHVVIMLGLATYLVYEAIQRAGDTPDIHGWTPLIVGAVGLGVNLATLRLLHPHSHDNLNARGAMYEVVADALGSVGVIVSGAVIVTTGWARIDLVMSLLIGALIVPRAIALLRPALSILLEGAPPGINVDRLVAEAADLPGVIALHDVHVWTINPKFVLLSAHVEVDSMDRAAEAIAGVTALARSRHGIEHVTLQPETPELHEAIACCEFPDADPALLPRHAHVLRS